jgi:hypothetical protein
MPHIFAQFPFPKASLAVLRVFAKFARLELDLTELEEQSQAIEEKLGELLSRVEQALTHPEQAEEEERYATASDTGIEEEPRLAPADEQRLERLFSEAEQDRSRAYELKGELDRLGVFKDYEDRFLDLFKKQN